MASIEIAGVLFPDFTGGSPPSPACAAPFEALDYLLVVIEALCPIWPPRPVDTSPWVFKI